MSRPVDYSARLARLDATYKALDDRFEWVEVTTLADPVPRFIIARCKHVETVDVDSCVTGEILARICLVCDDQLAPAPGDFVDSHFNPDIIA